jgi:hypothetical protein
MVQKIMVPPYFGPISCWKQIINSNILWDVHQNYIKQTYRNRTFIHSANGLQKLTVPVKHSKIKFSMLEAKIDNTIAWQKNHWRSIQSAYSSSPFFEFYKDSLEKIYLKKYTDLTKFNFDIINLIFEWIEIEIKSELSKGYNIRYENSLDLRKNIENKRYTSSENIRYRQVFSNKNGFLNDLSIMDLIFNEGPNSISYLK